MTYLEVADEKALGYFLSTERYLRYSGAQIELSHTWRALGRHFLKRGEKKNGRGYLKKVWEVFSSVDPRLFPEGLVEWISNDQRVEVTLNRIIKLNEALQAVRATPFVFRKSIERRHGYTIAMRAVILSEEERKLKIRVSRNMNPASFDRYKTSVDCLYLIRNEYELVLSIHDDLKDLLSVCLI